MDESRRGEALANLFVRDFSGSHLAKLIVDGWQQLLRAGGVSLVEFVQDAGDVGHKVVTASSRLASNGRCLLALWLSRRPSGQRKRISVSLV